MARVVLLCAIAAVCVAPAARADVACAFTRICESSGTCGETAFDLSAAPASGGSVSRVIVNGTRYSSGPMTLSTAMGVVQASILGNPDGTTALLAVHDGVTHLLTLAEDGISAAYTLQAPGTRTTTSYFGTCEGAL